MLSWEVLCIYSTASCEHAWEVLSDLYFYRDPEKIEKEEQTTAEKVVTKDEFQGQQTALTPQFTAAQSEVIGWSEHVGALLPIQQFPTEDWSTPAASEDWSAVPIAQGIEWVVTTTQWP